MSDDTRLEDWLWPDLIYTARQWTLLNPNLRMNVDAQVCFAVILQ